MAKKEVKPKTTKSARKRKTSDEKPRWYITKGWGNLDDIVAWRNCESTELAYSELAEEAQRRYPKVYTKVWTQSFLKDGIVCDFGSHVYFGFLKNVKPYTPANLNEPKPTKPPRPVSAPDYLDCPDGIKLRNLFSDWFYGIPKDTNGETNWWWRTHALQYCLVKEWYDMLVEEEPSIDEIWDYDMTPEDIFTRILSWSVEDWDGAQILLQGYPDGRWDTFHRALTWKLGE